VADTFSVSIQVRGYELDTQGHLNQAVYMQYAEHARWELLRAAGVTQDRLVASGAAPVQLEATIRYHRELRANDEVEVSCSFEWGSGKTFRVRQEYHRVDGTRVAELVGVAGMLDLKTRKLVPDPRERLRALATSPELFA
jgi:acyl-CoA thioester hydrolase